MEKRHRVFIAINLPEDIKKELFSYSEKYGKKFQEVFASHQNEILDMEPAHPHTKVSDETYGVGIKWTTKDNLHITLEFLGYLTDEEIGEVCIIVKEVAKRHNSFDIKLDKICYGPHKLHSGQVPKFIWAEGLSLTNFGQNDANIDMVNKNEISPKLVRDKKSKELSKLREDLENSLTEKIKFAPEGRGFTPHITLARISAFGFKAIEPEERPEIDEKIDLSFTVESIEVMESVLKRGGPVHTVLESDAFGE